MGSIQDLNQPPVYAEALVRAALEDDTQRLACWLASDEGVVDDPFWKWYAWFADRLRDMAPRPELGFHGRNRRNIAQPAIGRNDRCPCGSGKKFKQCHMEHGEGAVAWKLGSPTEQIMVMAVATLVEQLPAETLLAAPMQRATVHTRVSVATVLHDKHNLVQEALSTLKPVLDGPRDDPNLLFDYWIARYVEWLVEAGQVKEAENLLLDEYDHPRATTQWQIAQKLAAFYLDQGDPDEADSWIEASLEGSPNNPFTLYLKGLLQHTLSHWDEAVTSYEQALAEVEQFQEPEQQYMTQLIDESLQRARQQLPVEQEDEPSDPIDEKGEPS
ncbi:MAG: SEC-C domain-containing protein [Magnetococcales bacterium]|nr:SEC-C domain-containing protein [Magnetococcales bacterium]